MGRLLAFVLVTLLLDAGMTSTVRAACPRNPDVSTARARWASTREKIDSLRNEDNCRVSSSLFWEAVNIRQVVFNCEEGTGRERDLDGLDAEIEQRDDCGSMRSLATSRQVVLRQVWTSAAAI